MLSDTLKEEIQAAYSQLLDEKGYRARHCQKVMIAEIARTLGDQESDQNICVVEAGTGTGKTVAYAVAAIPIARHLNRKVVIATATVALQEQIVYQDLPDIRRHSGLEFSYALAKGRRRYVCLSRLDLALQEGNSMNHTLSFFDGQQPGESRDDNLIFDAMMNSLGKAEWDGERDSWPEELEASTWNRVSTDHTQCTQRRCSHYENCYFYRARENVHRVDVVVTNQDLVLSDLMMGGGAVLPGPEETIYIFDEAHHLPDKAGNHFSHLLSLYGTRDWLPQMATSLNLAAADVPGFTNRLTNLDGLVDQACERLDDAAASLQARQPDAESVDDGWLYRYPNGQVDSDIARRAAALATSFERLSGLVEQLLPIIEAAIEETPAAVREPLEHWLSVVGAMSDQLGAAWALWQNYASEELVPPYARWVRFSAMSQAEGMEMQLACHPVSVSDELHERLWSRCAGAVLTSATISVARDFTGFRTRSGIEASQQFASLPSPFRFREQAVLHIPAMVSDPGNADAHTEELAELIPVLGREARGTLVLFTSWRQMLRVCDDMDAAFREQVLLQGDLTKMEILTQHRQRIDDGDSSCIFGLASFAEGVDLPGDYCRHVIIAKIPFSVPDDPVDATRSEWIEAGGGNAFYEVMLPGAALRVVQAAGRLLRTETDSGRVTILDRRIVTRSYGRVILDSLPPFAREIH